MTRAKVLAVLGYTSFFWLCFFAVFYWTFPYDRLARFVSDKVAASSSGYRIEIGQLSPSWLTGVALEDVKVSKQRAPKTLGTQAANTPEPAKQEPIVFKEVRARVGVLSLLAGSTDVSFDAELEKGSIEGEFFESEELTRIDATLDKLDIGRLGLLDSLISLPAVGTLQGDVDLTLAKDPAQSNGKVLLTIKGFTLGDGQAKIQLGSMGGLTVDPVNAGDVTLELDVTAGVGQVKRLTANGTDVELEGTGEVRFAQPLVRSRIDITLEIKFTDAYKNKSGRTKAMFSLLESTNSPQVKSAMTPDGGLAYRLLGAFATMRAIPAGKTVAQRKGLAPSRENQAPPADEDDEAE